jgi:hypothetical protein
VSRAVPILAAAVLLILAGCARYEFDLIDPPDLATHVGEKQDTVFRTDAAEYRLRAVSGRLVMRVYNTGEQPLTLAGERSSVVDPAGESHPLIAQTIEPGSYIRLLFPPPLPTLQRSGPSFRIGVGGGYRYGYYRFRDDRGRRYTHRYPRYDPYFADDGFYETRYYRVYDDANPLYWDWRGEGQIRIKLVYELPDDGETLEDRFVIVRTKM